MVCRHAGHTHADVGRYLPKRGQYRCFPATCRRLRMEDGGSGHRHACGAMGWGTGGISSSRTQTSPAISPYELSRSPGRLPSSSQGSLQPSRPPPLLRSQPRHLPTYALHGGRQCVVYILRRKTGGSGVVGQYTAAHVLHLFLLHHGRFRLCSRRYAANTMELAK